MMPGDDAAKADTECGLTANKTPPNVVDITALQLPSSVPGPIEINITIYSSDKTAFRCKTNTPQHNGSFITREITNIDDKNVNNDEQYERELFHQWRMERISIKRSKTKLPTMPARQTPALPICQKCRGPMDLAKPVQADRKSQASTASQHPSDSTASTSEQCRCSFDFLHSNPINQRQGSKTSSECRCPSDLVGICKSPQSRNHSKADRNWSNSQDLDAHCQCPSDLMNICNAESKDLTTTSSQCQCPADLMNNIYRADSNGHSQQTHTSTASAESHRPTKTSNITRHSEIGRMDRRYQDNAAQTEQQLPSQYVGYPPAMPRHYCMCNCYNCYNHMNYYK